MPVPDYKTYCTVLDRAHYCLKATAERTNQGDFLGTWNTMFAL